MNNNRDKAPLGALVVGVCIVAALSMIGLGKPLLSLMNGAPAVPVLVAAAIVGARYFMARDVALSDAVAAAAPVALAAWLATVAVPNRQVGVDQWEVLALIGGAWAVLAVAVGFPALGTWKELDNGQRIRSRAVKQGGVYVEQQEDSRTRHRVWARRNLIAKAVIAASIVLIVAGAYDKGGLWVAAWGATIALAAALALFGWGQLVRLSFVAYEPAKPQPAAPPTHHQTQTQQQRRKKLS